MDSSIKKTKFQKSQIAPCGANCRICMGFLKKGKACLGCRAGNENKPKSCISCTIKNCKVLLEKKFTFCYECDKFPCSRMEQLNNRYIKNYKFSMIENLLQIKKEGIENFLINELERWICSDCGGIISVHRGYCSDCRKVYYVHTGTNRAPIK